MPPPLLSIGYGNFVASDKIIAVVEPDSAPIKRVLAEYRLKGMLIDATAGHKTRAVLAMESGHLILSANKPETLASKVNDAPVGRRAENEARRGENEGRRGESED